jgi:hypothetical protein
MLFYRLQMGIAHFGTVLLVLRHLLQLPEKEKVITVTFAVDQITLVKRPLPGRGQS